MLNSPRRFTFDNQPIFLIGEKSSGIGNQKNIQDFYKIRQECLASGKLFEDPDFPATEQSVFRSRHAGRRFQWLRPKELCDNPQFFVDGFSRFDVIQGELGDCWLLAATANLTQNPKLFYRVVCDDNSFDRSYAGVFHFRFWQYGKWIDVVVDDRLPTYKGELMFMHSKDKNEFWSALLEKAYTKLYGAYEAIRTGSTSEALEDFTGGVTEMFMLKNAPENLFSILMKGFQRNSMMGCSIEPDPHVSQAETPEGLICGHAYSITKVAMVDIVTPNVSGKIPLLRLRNPWGNDVEWNGPWSDKSKEWNYIPEKSKKSIDLSFDPDGEFWMSYRDFLKYFDRVEICNLSPDSLSKELDLDAKKKWHIDMFSGKWVAGASAGGCRNFIESFHRNPQYVMTLEKADDDDEEGKCSVVILLMQKNRRTRGTSSVNFLSIGFAIYQLKPEDMQTMPQPIEFFKTNVSTAKSEFINMREVNLRIKLKPGSYLIVPSTYEPNEEGEFLIRVFSEGSNVFKENERIVGLEAADNRTSMIEPEMDQSPTEGSTIEKLFKDVAGPNQEIGWAELKQILDHAMRDEFLNKNETVTTSNITKTNNAVNGSDSSNTESSGCGLLAMFRQIFPKNDLKVETTIPYNNNNLPSQLSTPKQNVTNLAKTEGFSKDICRSMVAMLDTDYSGKLGLEEFKILLNDIAHWKAVFKFYDPNNTKELNAFELRDALSSAGYYLNNRIIDSLVYRYGSPDKTITIDDFLMCAVKVKTMIDHFRDKDYNHTNKAMFSIDEWVTKALYS